MNIVNINEQNKFIEKVMQMLADFIGVEKDDILPEFSFTEDLHMSYANLSDFLESLKELDIDISKIETDEIETVEELLEQLEANEPIE